jgi:hypothetical protein
MAGRPGRRWFPLDVNFTRDERVLEAGWTAARLFLAVLGHLYAVGNDSGRITRLVVPTLGVPRWEPSMDRLIKAGLMDEPDPDSFVVVSWEMWRTEAESTARTREWRARQRSQRDVT